MPVSGRLIRNTVVLLKEEVTYGVDPTPAPATDALLVSNLSINPLNATNVDRDIIRAWLGGSEQLVGTRFVDMSVDLELTGSGTVAVAPAWGPALRSCAMAETVTATFRVDYTPVSTGMKSCTIYWQADGLQHKATGVRGNPVFKMGVGQRPVISFKFMGLYSTPTAVGNGVPTLTAWKVPQVITEANTLDVMFGGTHTLGTAPAITGGTAQVSQGLEVDLGNKVDFNAMLGGESMDISQRTATGKVTLDLSAANEATFMAAVEAATLQSVGMSHGTVANQKVLLWLPNVQLINPQKTESNGKHLVSFDMRCLPTATGNDEVRLVTSF